MTVEQALYTFYAGFGCPAYQEDSVPTGADAPEYPYITYELQTGSFGQPVPLSASVWSRSTSLKEVLQIANNLLAAIDAREGKPLPTDDGGIRLFRGNPELRVTGESSDDMVKRAIINIMAEYIR